MDSALILSETATDSLSSYITSVRYHDNLNDTTKAYIALKKVLSLQNKLERELISQSSIVAQRDYYEDEMTVSKYKTAQREYFIVFLLIFSIVIVAILLIWWHYKIKNHNIEIELKMAQIVLLRDEMEHTNTKLKNIKSTYEISKNKSDSLIIQLEDSIQRQNVMYQLSRDIFGDRIKHLNLFINQFYDIDSSEHTKKSALYNIKCELEKLTDKSNITEIERIVNTFNDDIIDKIRQSLPDFSENDINFLTLTIAGFNSRAISLFMGIKPNSTYTKRQRLINRIRKIDSPYTDWFVTKIDNSWDKMD